MPWYVKDWFSSEDRSKMTYEARGIYRDLLDYAWLHHGLPTDKKVIAQWLGITERKFSLNWSMMADCWEERDGRLFNKKQDRVRQELEDFRHSKSESGRTGGLRSGEVRRARNTVDSEKTEQIEILGEAQLHFASSKREARASSKTKPSSSSSSSSTEEPKNGSSVSIAVTPAPHPIREFLAFYELLFTEQYGAKPVIVRGKDPKLAESVLKANGEARAWDLMRQFFRSADPFVAQSGHTLSVFVSVQNKLIAELSGRAPVAAAVDGAAGRQARTMARTTAFVEEG
jgi:hypothetical protein